MNEVNESISRSLVPHSAMPMALLNADGTIRLTSPPWNQLFGAATALSALIADSDSDAIAASPSSARV